MKVLSIEETADLLTSPSISIVETTHMGAMIAHKCIYADGTGFVLVNGGSNGESVVVEL